MMTYVNGGNLVFSWATPASITSGAPNWSANALLTENTEWSPSNPNVSFGILQLLGSGIGMPLDLQPHRRDMENAENNPNTPSVEQRIRFAVESLSSTGVVNFPVTMTVALDQYSSPTSPTTYSQLSNSNYFIMTYTTSSGVADTAYYSFTNGQTMTIPNVQSYSNFLISDQSSASTTAEKWCLVYGNSCSNNNGQGYSPGFTTLGASDGFALIVLLLRSALRADPLRNSHSCDILHMVDRDFLVLNGELR